MKTTVAIDKQDNEFLTELAKKRGISKSELMKLLVKVAADADVVGASEDGEVAVTSDGTGHDLDEITEEVLFAEDNFHPIVPSNGEARDVDPVISERPQGRCLACERGGPRRSAPHTCGKPSPQFAPRSIYA